MRKMIFAALAAVLALSLTAGVASAERGVSVSPSNTTLSLPGLELEGGLGTPVRCNVTMDTALHERIAKVQGTLTGNADIAVSTGGCTDGNAGLLVGGRRVTGAQGPYHVTYESFDGELPNIESVTLTVNNVIFWISISGIDCLTNGAVDISGTTTGGNPATGIDVTAQNVPLTGDFLCIFSSGDMKGSGSLSSSIRMTLF